MVSKIQAWQEEWAKKKKLREELTDRINHETLMDNLRIKIGENIFEVSENGQIRNFNRTIFFKPEDSVEFAKWVLDLWGISHG